MVAAKPEVVSTLEINNVAEKFRRISPILLRIYVAGITAEHLVHNGTCKFQIGGQKSGSSYNFAHTIDRNTI
jgi:hypothetical protein